MVSDTIFGRLLAALCGVLLMSASPMAAADVSLTLSSGLKAKLLALPHLTGETLAAADFAGKVTIVSFFASWCPPCNAEFRHLAELREHYGGDLTIVSVNVFEDYGGFKDHGARLQRFLRRHDPQHAVIAGDPSVREVFGNIERIPTLYVFGRDGKSVFEFIHAQGATKTNATMAEVLAAVDAALKTPSG